MDLTLECIRRHYIGSTSPLAATLDRHRDFFALFGDFRRCVDFFLLQDLVTPDLSAISFFAPFTDFATPPVPREVETYAEFMRKSIEFVEARKRRIAAWSQASQEQAGVLAQAWQPPHQRVQGSTLRPAVSFGLGIRGRRLLVLYCTAGAGWVPCLALRRSRALPPKAARDEASATCDRSCLGPEVKRPFVNRIAAGTMCGGVLAFGL